MSYSRVGCLWLSLLLTITIASPSPQVRTASYKPLFENHDFKVFAVRNPESLPSISDESNFGVLVFRDNSTTWDTPGEKCPFCFTGPTGRRNLLVFGNPTGVVPLAEKHPWRNQPPVWIALRPDAEITEHLFKKNLPEDFKDSVRDDLFSIGFLADRAGSGVKPTEKEQARASAALNDLTFKSKWFSLFNGSAETPPPLIKVKVHTIKSGAEVQKWTVWYVLDGWEDDQDHTYTFDNQSSPTEQEIVPGKYKMWASRGKKPGKKKGPVKTVPVGDTPSLTKELQLETP